MSTTEKLAPPICAVFMIEKLTPSTAPIFANEALMADAFPMPMPETFAACAVPTENAFTLKAEAVPICMMAGPFHQYAFFIFTHGVMVSRAYAERRAPEGRGVQS